MPGLFNKKILEQRIKNYSVDNIERKVNQIKNWQKNLADIKGLNEVELQNAFMGAIFEDILGYEDAPQKDKSTLKSQASTDVDATRPDGIIGFYDKTKRKEEDHRAVIELKGPQIPLEKDQKRKGTTYRSPVDQGFSYTNKLDKCRWVIVSNFTEIRLYQVGRSKEYYEIFYLNELDDIEEFKRFHYLLSKNNLISKDGKSQTLQLTEKTQKRHEDISVEFYNLYKNARINLFGHLKENNENIDFEVLLEKAQKFLDRIIFICFCEDKGLLPNDLLHNAIKQAKNSFYSGDTRIWDQIRGVFKAIDKGMPNKNINAYNGGLFEFDKVLDVLVIKDDFFDVIYDFSDYDFDSDVDVNILGHIFEQSISDIEKLKSDIKDNEFDKNKSRRKKEGIYYTPQYITSYIVENAVGGYLEDIKEDMGYYDLPDIEEAGSDSWQTRYTNQHLEFYDNYEEKLKEIKVLDPACGSGAFLNQAFDYLLQEHQWLNKQRDLLKGGQSSIYAVEALQRTILKNNLYGVDLNEESVEITKLSLWLKTANKNKQLTNLDNNIKCSNSLIDNPEVVGEKAFKWEKEFADIMVDGGFDVVIGNPPYVRQEKIKNIKPYLSDNYKVYNGVADLYVYFIEKSIKLLDNQGYFSFIVSNKFTKAKYGEKLRKFLMNYTIKQINDYSGEKVFKDAAVDPCIVVLKKKISNLSNKVELNNNVLLTQDKIAQYSWTFSNLDGIKIYEKVKDKGINLEHWDLDIYFGIKTGLNKAFIISQNKKDEIISKNPNAKKIIRPLITGQDISRYRYSFNNQWLILIENGWTDKNRGNTEPYKFVKNKYPFVIKHLKNIGDKIERGEVYSKGRGLYKRDDQGDYWWELRPCNYYDDFEKPKIIYKDISERLAFAYDDGNIYFNNTVYFLNVGNFYLLSVLNSKLINFYYKNISSNLGLNASRGFTIFIKKIPIPKNIVNNRNDLAKKTKLITNKYKKYSKKKLIDFNGYIKLYCSSNKNSIKNILEKNEFANKIYSGRARKVRNFTVNINTNIVTIYSEKSSSGKYELLKYEENNEYKRRYIKYYLENLTEDQLEKTDSFSGNLLEKVLQIEIPDYNKDQVVRKVVNEWENLQQEIKGLENEIEKTDNEIDQMVYDLYNLTEEEINIIENNMNK